MTLLDHLHRHAIEHPTVPAIIHDGEVVTYAELSARVSEEAQRLRDEEHVQPGQLYQFVASQDVAYLVRFLALHEVGAICVPVDAFMDDLRKVLAFRPFVTFEAWHPADNISDDEILAAEKTISHGTLAKLERFRDQNRKTDFFMALDETHATYKMVLNNLRYLLCLLAHQAKRYGSFPAARSFLSAASLVYRRTSEATPYFRDTDIENLIDQFNDGIDELQIAADYKNMEDWEPYRAREAERFAAAMKEREAVLGERGK